MPNEFFVWSFGVIALACLFFVLFIFAIVVLKVLVYQTLFRDEIKATLERDPAASGRLTVILTYPGLDALYYYRTARVFRKMKLFFFSRLLSQLGRWTTGCRHR